MYFIIFAEILNRILFSLDSSLSVCRKAASIAAATPPRLKNQNAFIPGYSFLPHCVNSRSSATLLP